MGVSLLTALIIQENGAEVAVGKGKNVKYSFEIYSIIREHYRPHLTCEPIYDSEGQAKEEGNKVLKAIKEFDTDNHRKELSALLGDDAKTVQKVIDASKEGR